MKSLISTAEILYFFFHRILSDIDEKLLNQKLLFPRASKEMRFLGMCITMYCMSLNVISVLNVIIHQHSQIKMCVNQP